MYHDLMDLYGDKGNIETLRYRASKRSINVVVDTCTLQEERNIEDYDIFFLGGGADKEQTLIYKDLLARKESILKAKESGIAFLLICIRSGRLEIRFPMQQTQIELSQGSD